MTHQSQRHGALAKAPALLFCALILSLLAVGSVLAADPPSGGHGTEQHDQAGHDDHGHDDHGDGHGGDGHGGAHGGHGDGHGDGHGGGHGGHIELPNTIMLLRHFVFKDGTAANHWLHVVENPLFAILAGTVLTIIAISIYRRRSDLPGRAQAFAEIIVEQADNLTRIVIGPEGRNYTPFVGTLFLYILFMNYSGLIPFGKASTATFLNNFSLAIVVFLYVQWTGIRKNGIKGYLHHLAGSPKDAVGWGLSPLMFVLEVVGEFIKPVSLSLRLFGNIFGEDMLLAIFALLGTVVLSFIPFPIGLPLHLPFLLLSLLLGFIQAMVFSLLATVYLSLMLPHGDHGHGDEAHA